MTSTGKPPPPFCLKIVGGAVGRGIVDNDEPKGGARVPDEGLEKNPIHLDLSMDGNNKIHDRRNARPFEIDHPLNPCFKTYL